jgi:hypothetical protein
VTGRRVEGRVPSALRRELYRKVWIHWRRDPAGGGASIVSREGMIRLNPVAAAVWQELERVPNRETLHRRMRRRYRGVGDATLRAEIDSLIDRWLEADWIARVEDPVFPSSEKE